jgi:CheY-like chemotaxis protein
VLLVEDEGAVRQLARTVLELTGCGVLEAADGEEAVAVSGRDPGPVHLLVTDLRLPGMSGLELAGRLRTLRPGLPVVCMSGWPDDLMTEERAGCPFPVLAKPFRPSDLTGAVRQAIESSEGGPGGIGAEYCGLRGSPQLHPGVM